MREMKFMDWSFEQWCVACGQFSGSATEIKRKWDEKYNFQPTQNLLSGIVWPKNYEAAGEIWQQALANYTKGDREGWE